MNLLSLWAAAAVGHCVLRHMPALTMRHANVVLGCSCRERHVLVTTMGCEGRCPELHRYLGCHASENVAYHSVSLPARLNTDLKPSLFFMPAMAYALVLCRWGGRRIQSASNIVFSNGLLDPWHTGGVLEVSLGATQLQHEVMACPAHRPIAEHGCSRCAASRVADTGACNCAI